MKHTILNAATPRIPQAAVCIFLIPYFAYSSTQNLDVGNFYHIAQRQNPAVLLSSYYRFDITTNSNN
jgi:hypothetical protein